MRSGRQREFSLRLAPAEVEMVLVVGDRLVERRQVRIDQEMMMTRIGPLRARRRDAHAMQAEMDRGFWPDDGAVLDVDEFNLGARRGWRGSALSGGLRKGGASEKKARYDRDRRPSRSPHRRSPMILARCPRDFRPAPAMSLFLDPAFEPRPHNDLL